MSSQERGHVLDPQLVASLVDDSSWHGRSQAVKNIDINQKIGRLGANISLFFILPISSTAVSLVTEVQLLW